MAIREFIKLMNKEQLKKLKLFMQKFNCTFAYSIINQSLIHINSDGVKRRVPDDKANIAAFSRHIEISLQMNINIFEAYPLYKGSSK